ncbi:hypothetical protein CFK37_04910 [Virgibacillus phasianinus]|uniref:Uncharacterized protein n=1 Tax=Virgibacillus phasianinus TaxID=2017483 RepID=A0A220U0G6_9BACI|nr:hypothetical protein [Virgibacillus phasianinus]ASK61560.1 hypothetical protein CFK37_04910 [Virgibacillus phasianinus]
MFGINLLKWMPHNEQSVYEKKLMKVMKELKIENYHFNWDRTSCFIEFQYLEKSYKLEHSIEKAKRKGLILRNGLDCLMELTQSLEDLCGIINRGTYNFDAWIAGMKQSSSEQEMPEFEEEFQFRYKSLGTRNLSDFNDKEFIPFATEPEENTDQTQQNHIIRRRQRNQGPLI